MSVSVWNLDQTGGQYKGVLVDEFYYIYNVSNCRQASNSGQQLIGKHQKTQ